MFQSLKQNEDKSRDLGKRGRKAYYIRLRKATGEGRKRKGPRFAAEEARRAKGQKKRATQDVRAQTEASITATTHGLLALHMVTRLF